MTQVKAHLYSLSVSSLPIVDDMPRPCSFAAEASVDGVDSSVDRSSTFYLLLPTFLFWNASAQTFSPEAHVDAVD